MRTALPPWWWRHAGLPSQAGVGSSLTPDPFPQARLPLAVDLSLFGNWVDISDRVYQRDRVVISRGRSSEAGTADPTSIRLTLDNRDGLFSPRNPLSPYYGQIGRNTPLRVRVADDVRGVGEVVAWPPKWDLTGTDVWVPVEAAGVLRRLQQGVAALRSTLYRGVTSLTSVIAYWPCEDDTAAATIASAVGGPAMTVTGTPAFAASTPVASTAALPTVGNSRWRGPVSSYTGSGAVELRFLLSTAAAMTTNTVVARMAVTGTIPRWDVVYTTASGGTLALKGYDSTAALVADSGAGPLAVDGVTSYVLARVNQAGADLHYDLYAVQVGGDGTAVGTSGTFPASTLVKVTAVEVDPGGVMDQVTVGHVSVQSAVTEGLFSADLFDQANAYVGEAAGDRLARLCAEGGVAFTRGDPGNATEVMGAQLPGKLVDLLRECETADQGILYEPRGTLGLAYVSRVGLYNQAAALTLDYAAADLSQFDPTDDDQSTRNDITVTRTAGSSARAVLDSGALSTADPPDGVGRYDTAVTVNVGGDSVLPDHAGWRLHLGTVDEPRFPQAGVNLARANFTAGAAGVALAAASAALDVGQAVTVSNPPAWLPPGAVTQLAVGFEEGLNAFERTIVVNCVPASPWTVGVYDDAGGRRYSSDGSTLTAEAAAGVTSLSVTTPAGPLWADGDGDFDVTVSGERCTVTAVVGGSSPQTFTVVRAVNGISKTLPAGSAVDLAQPAVYAL